MNLVGGKRQKWPRVRAQRRQKQVAPCTRCTAHHQIITSEIDHTWTVRHVRKDIDWVPEICRKCCIYDTTVFVVNSLGYIFVQLLYHGLSVIGNYRGHRWGNHGTPKS